MQARFGERADVADRMVPLQLGLEMEYAALRFWEHLEKERS
jgi:PadR family transcriptional regulator AphA